MNNVILGDDSVIFQNRFFDIYTGELLAPIETPNYTVVQVAESYYLNAFDIDAHRQICDLEITLPLTAGILATTNGCTKKLNKNEPFLSFKGEIHAISCRKSGRFQTLAFNIKEGPCKKLLSPTMECCICADISKQMIGIISEFASAPLPHFPVQLDALITEILIALIRSGNTPKAPDLCARDLLPRVLNYLDTHYLEPDPISTLPAKFGYSYGYLCKQFKAAYRISPAAYLKSKRMDHAKGLLQQGQTVTAIAEKLCYSSAFNFSRAYKNHFGVSPTLDEHIRE